MKTLFSTFGMFMLIALLFYFIIMPITCTDKDGAYDALLKAGYHPIEVGGYGYFSGSEDDVYVTKFKAYNADTSQIVTGVVCSGYLKNKTIRIE